MPTPAARQAGEVQFLRDRLVAADEDRGREVQEADRVGDGAGLVALDQRLVEGHLFAAGADAGVDDAKGGHGVPRVRVGGAGCGNGLPVEGRAGRIAGAQAEAIPAIMPGATQGGGVRPGGAGAPTAGGRTALPGGLGRRVGRVGTLASTVPSAQWRVGWEAGTRHSRSNSSPCS